MDTKIKEPKYLTLREIAALCRCSLVTVRRRIAQKRFKGVDFVDIFHDGRILAPKDQVMTFLSARHKATANEYDASVYLRRG
jgi:hypothetical protein